MEDDRYCAVCAEELHWVAYGPCGHRHVCATCTARLRFVCHDRRCCICMSLSPRIFVSKARGSFTRVINNFSILPADAKDGKVGSYWFYEAIQAYFDDFDEYKVIKALCSLSCSLCDKAEAKGRRTSKRKGKFKSIEQLKDHLFHRHELLFCSLCLEHKKVFICEQKLYTQMQLSLHIKAGDSEVDGDENERCGFFGHPLCKYCQMPFYSENELYFHMSTEHFTCHICQREQPTNIVYYQDYDHLENHFREDHFLCEDDSCLENKFVVFASEADMKRHNASEHGGNMSRSKHNATSQLSTCLRSRVREDNAPRVPTRSDRSGETGSSSEQVQSNALDLRSVLMSGPTLPPLPRTSKRRRRKSKKNSGETSANHSASNGSSTKTTSSSSSSSRSIGSTQTLTLTLTSDGTVSSSNGAGSSSPDQNGVGLVSVGPFEHGDIASKSLVEAIRAALEFDKKYREGLINAKEYLAHVHQFGLAHLILESGKLCPNSQKKTEFIRSSRERSEGSSSKKGKGKCEDTGKLKATPNNIVNLVKEMKLDSDSTSLEGKIVTGTKKKTKKSKFCKAGPGESSSSSSSVSDLNWLHLVSDPMMIGRRLVTLSRATPIH